MLDELAHLEPALDEAGIAAPRVAGRSWPRVDERSCWESRAGAARAWKRYRWLAPRLERETGAGVLRVDVSDARDAYVLMDPEGGPAPRAAVPRSAARLSRRAEMGEVGCSRRT